MQLRDKEIDDRTAKLLRELNFSNEQLVEQLSETKATNAEIIGRITEELAAVSERNKNLEEENEGLRKKVSEYAKALQSCEGFVETGSALIEKLDGEVAGDEPLPWIEELTAFRNKVEQGLDLSFDPDDIIHSSTPETDIPVPN